MSTKIYARGGQRKSVALYRKAMWNRVCTATPSSSLNASHNRYRLFHEIQAAKKSTDTFNLEWDLGRKELYGK